MIDESHGDWEDSRSPIDTKWFGSRTVYNYFNFSQSLAKAYDVQKPTSGLPQDLLDRASVVILKTPTKPYDAATVERLVRFVEEGGGLWLIGDHTDAFGINSNLNAIARPLGFDFRSDAIFEYAATRNIWAPERLSHPTVQNLPPFLFYTGCSIRAPWYDTRAILGTRLLSEHADYSAGSFFRPLRAEPSNRMGAHALMVAAERGKGRVVVWSDGTLFSNFAVYLPGKMELAFNSVEWLSRRNGVPYARPLLMGIGLVCLLSGILALRSPIVLMGLLMVCALGPALRVACERIKPLALSSSAIDPSDVHFIVPERSIRLPVLSTADNADPQFYLSAFVGVQREGLRPKVVPSAGDLPARSVAVLVPEVTPMAKSERNRLIEWVRGGGRLMLLDGGKAADGEIHDLAGEFGLSLRHLDSTSEELVRQTGNPLGKDLILHSIGGGNPFLRTASGTVCGVEKRVGKGTVFFTTTLNLFADAGVGDVHSVPNDQQLATLRLLFRTYRRYSDAEPGIPTAP